jgi:hypothetical protein
MARDLQAERSEDLPEAFLGRLTEEERRWVTAQAAEGTARGATARDCALILRVRRLEAEREQLQRRIDQLLEAGFAANRARLLELTAEKDRLGQQLEVLK